MTDRIDDSDLSEMHFATAMSDASGFPAVQSNVKTMLAILRELIELRAAAKAAWIPVEETRPKDNHYYLVLFDDDQQAVAWYGEFGGVKWWQDNCDSADEDLPFQGDVHHYRELPPGLEGT